MIFARCILGLLLLLAAATSVLAQRPGDPIEYKASSYPVDKWEVGVYVRSASEGRQAIIREKPSQFYPEGFQRAIDVGDIRPATRPGAAAPARPAPVAVPAHRPAPVYVPAPLPAAVPVPDGLTACGPRPNPSADRLECVQQVQRTSPQWGACEAGDGAACHRFVRDVARALAAGDARWGLITKPRGQQACTEQACGRDVSGGFGEDMVAYLPDGNTHQQWLGTDIVFAAGAAGARPQWSNPNGYGANRADNLWSPVPR